MNSTPITTHAELARCLAAGDPSRVNGLLNLINKIAANDPAARERLAVAFPVPVAAWRAWQAHPGLTVTDLDIALGRAAPASTAGEDPVSDFGRLAAALRAYAAGDRGEEAVLAPLRHAVIAAAAVYSDHPDYPGRPSERPTQ